MVSLMTPPQEFEEGIVRVYSSHRRFQEARRANKNVRELRQWKLRSYSKMASLQASGSIRDDHQTIRVRRHDRISTWQPTLSNYGCFSQVLFRGGCNRRKHTRFIVRHNQESKVSSVGYISHDKYMVDQIATVDLDMTGTTVPRRQKRWGC